MKVKSSRILPLCMALALAGVLVYSVMGYLLPCGRFPERKLGGFENQSIGQHILEEAPQKTGAANVVTSVIWDYRGYDTLGEATVLFTAVVGIVALFRIAGRRD